MSLICNKCGEEPSGSHRLADTHSPVCDGQIVFKPLALFPLEWPVQWQYYARAVNAPGGATVKYDCGELIKVEKNGDLLYKCLCGSTFKRAPGFKNEECAKWVIEHTPHLTEDKNVPR